MSDFWLLRSPYRKPLVSWTAAVKLDSVVCPIDADHQHAGARLTELTLTTARTDLPDFVSTWMSEWLIHDDVLSVLRKNDITGFSVRPVKLLDKQGRPLRLKYWELIVTGWGGLASEASGVGLLRAESCDGCRHLVYSAPVDAALVFDEEQWDGSDFFLIWPLPKFVVITNRLAELFRSQSWQGFNLKPLEQLQVMSDTLSPGRLSYYFPEPRAKTVGEPLGIW